MAHGNRFAIQPISSTTKLTSINPPRPLPRLSKRHLKREVEDQTGSHSQRVSASFLSARARTHESARAGEWVDGKSAQKSMEHQVVGHACLQGGARRRGPGQCSQVVPCPFLATIVFCHWPAASRRFLGGFLERLTPGRNGEVTSIELGNEPDGPFLRMFCVLSACISGFLRRSLDFMFG